MSLAREILVWAACALALAACSSAEEEPTDSAEQGAPIVQLGAPGESNRPLTPQEASELPEPSFTQADVEFVRMMIGHHAQALEMTAMVESRTTSDDLPLLARRMDVSQRDEIAQLQTWLEEREQPATPDGQHDHGQMPGMLTPEQMAQLSEASGAEFDRLFLESMIHHHEGAVVMVEQLLTGGEGGQESQVFQLAQHINADQRVEISRMKHMLADR